MSDTTIVLFTFTATESAAVNILVESMARNGWNLERIGLGDEKDISWPRPRGGGTVMVRHRPLLSQGNVAAGGALTRALSDFTSPVDYFIFYGCCGVISPDDVGKIFRVASVSYLSLGVVRDDKSENAQPETVEASSSSGQLSATAADADAVGSQLVSQSEIVKLKSKWIAQTEAAQVPLPVYTLKHELMDLGVVDAHALATDKVIKVAPAPTAPAKAAGKAVYPDTEWTYGEAIAQYVDPDDRPLLIDMESYGIASAAVPIGKDLGIIVLRVATDALNDKAGQSKPEQQRLLTTPLPELARVIARIVDFSG